jgi:hypothetical protein
MTSLLDMLMHEVYPQLARLARQPELWQSLDIDYEPPRVERLWMPWKDGRFYLHLIHPCDKALFHPHPWPSAIMLLDGHQEMAVGYGAGDDPPPVTTTLKLAPDSSYEMLHPDGWHSVKPLFRPSLSVMLTGKPWGRHSPGKDVEHKPLPELAVKALLTRVIHYFDPI